MPVPKSRFLPGVASVVASITALATLALALPTSAAAAKGSPPAAWTGNSDVVTTLIAAVGPDLTVTKTHSGNFTPGRTGQYTITVTNSGSADTNDAITLTDPMPSGLTLSSIASGSDWNCLAGTSSMASCSRSAALPAGASASTLTLTVNVASNAPASVTNTATVSGGGETNTGNDTADDPTTINQPDLTVTKTHAGNFRKGGTGQYTITATNSGSAGTSGTVTVTDTLPTGLTATALSGSGWSCNLASLTCTRSDTLQFGSSYQVITLTVAIASNAPASVTNSATVSGGGETNTGNDTADDPTTINQPDLTVTKTHSGDFTQGGSGQYTITATNSGSADTTGTITVTDPMPSGLTLSASLAGTDWDCGASTASMASCSRSAALSAGASTSTITLYVDVADDAPASVTNTATVSGGGETNTGNDSADDPTTIKAAPSLVTHASPSVASDGQVTDTATLSGGRSPTGTITFKLYGPDDANCSGTPVVSTKSVSGNGDYVSDPVSPGAPGTYRWVASYGGDGDNDTTSGSCGDSDESVTVTDAPPAVSTTGGDTAYTEGAAAVVVDGGLDVSDTDSADLAGATVTISAGLESTDVLSFASQNGITGSYDTATGALTLTGDSSVANYQTALRSIKLNSSSEDPATSKTVEFQVDDGELDSNLATKDISVTRVDDPPNAADDSVQVAENSGATPIDVLANDSDVDGGPKQVESVTTPSHGTAAITGGGTGVSYQPAADYCNSQHGGTPDTFNYTLNGGSQGEVSVTVTCANTPAKPVVTVIKRLAPTSDPGRFDLKVGATVVKAAAGDGGRGSIPVEAGADVTVSEAVANGHPLSDYSTTIDCGAAGSGSGKSLTITRVSADVACTVTNTRRPAPRGHVRITHPTTTLSHGRALLRVSCEGEDGVRCRGTLRLESTDFTTRLHHAAATSAGTRVSFDISAGNSGRFRVELPGRTSSQLATDHKAIARAVARLDDGGEKSRLLTLIRH